MMCAISKLDTLTGGAIVALCIIQILWDIAHRTLQLQRPPGIYGLPGLMACLLLSGWILRKIKSQNLGFTVQYIVQPSIAALIVFIGTLAYAYLGNFGFKDDVNVRLEMALLVAIGILLILIGILLRRAQLWIVDQQRNAHTIQLTAITDYNLVSTDEQRPTENSEPEEFEMRNAPVPSEQR